MPVTILRRCLAFAAVLAAGAAHAQAPAYPSAHFQNLTVDGTITGGGAFLPLTGGTLSGPVSMLNGGSMGGTWTIGSPTFNNSMTIVGALTFGSSKTPGSTVTMSGSTNPTKLANLTQNWAGTSTITTNNAISSVAIGTSTDNAAIAVGGARSELQINGSYGGVNFSGGRAGVGVQMLFNTASTLASGNQGGVGLWSVVAPSANMGGISGAPKGSYFGSNFWARGATGATSLSQIVGQEIDASLQTGADATRFVIQQIALTSDHATHGSIVDAGQMLVAQVGTGAGVRWGYTIGDYQSQWPIDPNGLLFVAQSSENGVATTAAGGIDLLQAAFTGTAPEGGNFAFRTAGSGTVGATAIDGSGGLKIGSGYISANAAGLVLDAPLWVLSGTPTIGAGGSGYTTGDMVADSLGNIFTVTAAAGAVTAVAVTKRGEGNAANQSATVATVAVTRQGTTIGTGATLAEVWAQSTKSVQMASSGGRVGFYGTTPIAKQTGVAVTIAAVHAALTALGLIAP